MAKEKNSFILYCDILTTIEKLPDEMAGKLFKHILNYVNDNDPELDDLLLEIAFEPIKQTLKRDLKKYEKLQETARLNGLKGGRPRKNDSNNKKAKESKKTQPVNLDPRKAVSVSVSDSVSVKDQESGDPSPKEKNSLPTEINPKSWDEFLQHRKEIKKPMGKLAQTKAINILKDHSFDEQSFLIDYSITGRYTGLYPEQLEKYNGKNKRNLGKNEQLEQSNAELYQRATELEHEANGGGFLEIVDNSPDALPAQRIPRKNGHT